MGNVLKNIEPENVFRIFEEICDIPHASGNMEQISEYCVHFAKERGLGYHKDEKNNVIIFKDASEGYEDVPTVILQAHLDMVPDKTSDSNHDFEKDPLKLIVEDDYIRADNTTLGGDDGIGIALALAVLDCEDLSHPEIEVLLTVDEEIGMLGADAADLSMLKGEMLINIDSEVQGELTVGCAGGLRAECTIPVKVEDYYGKFVKLKVSGLIGGHSGIEINQERANANVLMGRVLEELFKFYDFSIAEIRGGKMDNAIARECESVLIIQDEEYKAIKEKIKLIEADIKNEYKVSDTDISINLNMDFEIDDMDEVNSFSKETIEEIIYFLKTAPNGVQNMEQSNLSLVETSLNLGMFWSDNEKIYFRYCVRSSKSKRRDRIGEILKALAESIGGECEISSVYPGWEYNPDNKLEPVMVKQYEEMFGESPTVSIIHAGLECGIIIEKSNVTSAVSFGPDILDIHTPQEKLSISSVKAMYEYLKEVLENIK